MSNVLTQIVIDADSRGEFIADEPLKVLRNYAQSGVVRANIVSYIANNANTIVSDTIFGLVLEQPELSASGGNAYGNRRMAACLRDTEFFLRYVTYAMFASNPTVLDDCLNGIHETYKALNVPLSSAALSVQIMKGIVIERVESAIEGEPNHYKTLIEELASYFDYIASVIGGCVDGYVVEQALQKLKESKQAATVNLTEADLDWEPDNYKEWLKRDRLVLKFQKYGIEDLILFEQSAISFFESWKRMPPQARREIWREREIMAELYDRMISHWKNIPTVRSVAVAERSVNGKNQRVGIVVFRLPPKEEYYELFNIPRYLEIASSITPLEEDEKQPVLILLEWMADSIDYSQQRSSELVTTSEYVDEAYVDEMIAPPLPVVPIAQSGDVIAGFSIDGHLGLERSVTLTMFVVPQASTDSSDIRLLTVWHGFEGGYKEVHSCEIRPPVKVGDVLYRSIPQEDLAKRIDVSLIKPVYGLRINPCLKWINVIPNPPIIPMLRMLVQMYGGTSQHQKGYIDYVQHLGFEPMTVVQPGFTARISAQPGDSGALLVAGNDESGEPFTNAATGGFSESYLGSMRFAMLGMLCRGTAQGTYSGIAEFQPLSTVCQYLKVKPYLPIACSLSAEAFQSHA